MTPNNLIRGDRYADAFTSTIRDELADQPDSPHKQAVFAYLRAIETTHESPMAQAFANAQQENEQ